jgi:putative DNA primase/helicase
VSAADFAARLRLHRSRDEWRGSCPTCGYPEAFALSLGKGGRLLGWCSSCQDKTAIAQLLREMQGSPTLPQHVERHDTDAAAKAERSAGRALALWDGSALLPDALVASTYLTTRGLPHLVASAALRFRGDCPHPSRCRLPALIALVVDVSGGPIGIHRTFLARNGSGKADIAPPRASLGPVRGGAIRLDPVADEICVGEGIESAASAGLLHGLPAWSAVSAGNLERSLMLPPQVRSVVIAADPDEPGRRAAGAAWHRWTAEGRRVRISTPNRDGRDFNNILLMRQQALGETR